MRAPKPVAPFMVLFFCVAVFWVPVVWPFTS